MTVRVQGVGIGLFAITAIWTVAILCCIIFHRTHKKVGTGVVAVASVATLILILVPRDSEVPKKAVFKLYDELFLWRTLLVILLGLSAIIGLLLFVVMHLMEPQHAQAVKQ